MGGTRHSERKRLQINEEGGGACGADARGEVERQEEGEPCYGAAHVLALSLWLGLVYSICSGADPNLHTWM